VSADPWDLEMAQRPAEEVPPLPVTILRPPPVPALSEDENASSGIALASSEHEGMVWYHQGQANLEAGQFDAAVRAFSIFVQNAPDHVYADRAQYWIGESYFRNGEYALAVVADNHFLSAYPESVKVPAVLWRAALSQEKMGHLQASQTILKDLVRRFPNETESVSASQKMTELSKLSRG
jgi:tol-pal system protein YbgF